jgi:hypothetical protein
MSQIVVFQPPKFRKVAKYKGVIGAPVLGEIDIMSLDIYHDARHGCFCRTCPNKKCPVVIISNLNKEPLIRDIQLSMNFSEAEAAFHRLSGQVPSHIMIITDEPIAYCTSASVITAPTIRAVN